MKHIIIFLVFVNITIGLFAQSDFFYTDNGEKEYFTIRKDRVILKAKSETEAKTLTKQTFFLSARNVGNDMVIATIDTVEIRLENLKQKTDAVDVAYGLEYTDGTIQMPTNKIFVKFNDGQSMEKVFDYVGLTKSIDQIELINENHKIYMITLNVALVDILKICRNLFETGLVEFAAPSFIREIKPLNHHINPWQWGLKNTGQYGGVAGFDIKAEQAWSITKGNANIKVAVIDDGVELTHPNLQPNLLQGYDATINPPGGANGSPYANDSHGTACAGIIGAIDGIGVASGCKIVPVRIAYNISTPNGPRWETNDIWAMNGIRYAWKTAKADVISCSWKWGSAAPNITAEINDAITLGRESKGCVVVFGSANDNASTVSYPASLPNVIAVGAISQCGQRKSPSSCDGENWWGSNYGSALDVVAPGVRIYTTTINGNYKSDFNGTSSACPHVAGIAALLLSVNPCLTQQEVRNIIELSCEKIGLHCYTTTSGRPNGSWSSYTGYGLVNAYRALQFAHSSQVHNFNNITGSVHGSSSANYQLNSQGICHPVPGVFTVRRTEIRATVSYPHTPSPVIVGTANGFSAANPNDGKEYLEVVSISETSATIRTFVYEGYNVLGQYLGWFPRTPANVRFNFKVLSAFDTDLHLQNQTINNTVSCNVINSIQAGNNYNIQNGANVTLRAGQAITLNPGFHAQLGSVFHAYIEPYFTCEQFPAMLASQNNDNIGLDYVIKSYEVEKSPLQTEKITVGTTYFKIYPNPASDYINIEYNLNNSETVEIMLYDNNGKLVYKLQNKTIHEAGIYSIQLTGIALPNGIYHCVLQTENRKETKKIIIR